MSKLESKADVTVIKIGSDVLRNKTREGQEGLDLSQMKSLARIISSYRMKTKERIVLVSSGAVAAGRRSVRDQVFSENRILNKQILASIGQPILMETWNTAFQTATPSLRAAQVLASRYNLEHSDSRNYLRGHLNVSSESMIPVVNENDSVAVDELLYGDNDRLAAEIAILLDAKRLILLTNVDGLYTANPFEDETAEQISELGAHEIDEDLLEICRSKSESGTGGMKSKLENARLAAFQGIEAVITSGQNPNCLRTVLDDADRDRPARNGTWIRAERLSVARAMVS